MSGGACGRLAVVVLTVLALLATSGCTSSSSGSSSSGAGSSSGSSPGGGQSVPASAAADWGYPALVTRQAQHVVDADQDALVKAYAAGAVAAAGARLSGPASEMLAARLRVATVRKVAATPDALTVTRFMVPRAGPWPRWFVAAGTDPVSPTPVLRVYVAATARLPYAMWAQLSLLPGVTVAEPAEAGLGAPSVAPDAAGLVATPAAVASAYATLLTTGRSPLAFAADPLRTQVADRTTKDRAALAGSASVTSVHAVMPGSVRAMRLSDGTVLVVAAIRQTYRVVLRRGSVNVDPDLAALAGRASFRSRLERTADEVVAFVVPGAGSGRPPVVVAAVKADVAATGS